MLYSLAFLHVDKFHHHPLPHPRLAAACSGVGSIKMMYLFCIKVYKITFALSRLLQIVIWVNDFVNFSTDTKSDILQQLFHYVRL